MKTKLRDSKFILPLLLFIYFIFGFAISVPYYSGDVKNHLVWGESILNLGPVGFYGREFHDFAFPNYPPVTMFLFALSLWVYKLFFTLIHYLNFSLPFFPSSFVPWIEWDNVEIAFLKIPAMIGQVGTGICLYLIAKSIKEKTNLNSFWLMALFLLNPATIYLSFVWGQIDLLPIMFYLISFLLLLKKRLILAFVTMTLALLSKQTIIIFIPVLLIYCYRLYGIKKTLMGLVVSLIVFFLAYLPFGLKGLMGPFDLYKLNFSLVAESTSVNSLNFWGFLYDFQPHSDKETVLFLTLQNWAYIVFLPIFILLTFFAYIKKISVKNYNAYVFLLTLSFFFILTRMHERYLIPAIVFSSILVLFDKKYWLSLGFFSLLHFVNLYRGLYQPTNSFLTTLADSIVFLKILVGGYLILMVYNFYAFIKSND